MRKASSKSMPRGKQIAFALVMLGLLLTGIAPLHAGKKKKEEAAPPPKPNILDVLDYSKIVWPNPPAITRIRYLNYFSAEKLRSQTAKKEKVSWMDRVSGVATGETRKDKPRFQLVVPYGVAVDSEGRVYVADSKVRAVFIFDTQTKDLQLLKNGSDARFGWITGLTIDDSDRLFVADSSMKRVLVFTPDHKLEGSITEGMVSPGGMAIDNENRYLYVPDAELDQVLVYDADPPYKLLRRMGTGSKDHSLTAPGEFAKPTNVAVDKDGNLYVSDTLNFRVEVFDAEGHFLRTFGKAGDGPGYFARPKGIAIDGDGHVWVADGVQNRVQVFTPEGKLLIWMGGAGKLPGQFSALAGLAIDKNNRVFTSEQYPGRVQMFQYINDADAMAERDQRVAEMKEKNSGVKGRAVASGNVPEPAAK